MSDEIEVTALHGTVIERNDIPLDELASRIRFLLKQIKEKSGADIWEVGELLRLAKLDYPSKEHFGQWLSANFADTPIRTLYDYYQLADKFYKRQEEVEVIPQSGLYLLAAPKCDEFREEVVESFQKSGGKASFKDVQDAIKRHAPPKKVNPPVETEVAEPTAVEQTGLYRFNNEQVQAIWNSFKALGTDDRGRLYELQEEIKLIIGEPK